MSWIPIQDQPKLLPCPFCGGDAKAFVRPGREYYIECRGACMVHPSVYGKKSLEEAVGDWNRRQSTAEAPFEDFERRDRLNDRMWEEGK